MFCSLATMQFKINKCSHKGRKPCNWCPGALTWIKLRFCEPHSNSAHLQFIKAGKANVLAHYTAVSMHDLKYTIITTLWLQPPLLLCFKFDECSQHASKHLNSEFFFDFFVFWEGEISLLECNDNNLEEMWCPLLAMKLKLTTHPESEGWCTSIKHRSYQRCHSEGHANSNNTVWACQLAQSTS